MLKNSNMEMEEKIYQLLSEKLGKTSLSERTIKSKAARLAKKVTKEDEITDDFILDAVSDLKDLEGQFGHDLKTELEKQVKAKEDEWKKKYVNKQDDNPPNPNPSDELKNEIEQIKKLRQEIEDERKQEQEKRKMNDLRSEVEKSLKNKGCTIDSYRELAIFKSPIDINKSVDDNVKAIEEIYNSTMANDRSNGFVPFHSNTLQQPLSEEDKIKKAKAEAAEFAKNPNNF